ncbi:uncharacterized protein N7482_007009 [Penicillium canariense]|uniref:Uncharacterized protein n=1 Tax=Penicillium canariense TaxID=189055 RepID=A0A9W9HYR4_9EURO|nr:uncharacterized protein N7482_007009 [Penicillium canariense]KAJ5160005.1 hypothetical protein N7482_007009 [Penicillium canariense]
MVPRAFLFTSAPPQKAMQPSGTQEHTPRPGWNRVGGHPTKHAGITASLMTTPVVIPPKRGSHTPVRREGRSRTPSRTSASSRRSSSSSSNDRTLPMSFASMLDATAIPVPRRSWSTRRPRKLPRGNHVEDFSRIMQEGLKAKEVYLMGGTSNSPLDILLSPPDKEHEKYSNGHEFESDIPFSPQSVSSDSVPSLVPDLGSPSSSLLPPTPAGLKSPSERRQLRYSPAEDCALDHPLLETEMDDCALVEFENHHEPIIHDAVTSKRSTSFKSFPSLRSSFKSNLTASLRAIKSAAQSVSTFTTPSVQPEDFLTRSLFTITPEMTDDRRPPPMQEPPSPALRRYLNPTPVSPAEMCVYHDHPHDKPQSASTCAVSIQMQTYRRSRGRGNRRNHFHVVALKNRDQYHTYDPEVPPMSRQREPRENSDFLRMVVLEMNMRRSGKLREDIPTRARIMLPPRKSNPYRLSTDYEDGDDNDAIPIRWVGVSV